MGINVAFLGPPLTDVSLVFVIPRFSFDVVRNLSVSRACRVLFLHFEVYFCISVNPPMSGTRQLIPAVSRSDLSVSPPGWSAVWCDRFVGCSGPSSDVWRLSVCLLFCQTPLLFFLHGVGGSADVWTSQIKYFSKLVSFFHFLFFFNLMWFD